MRAPSALRSFETHREFPLSIRPSAGLMVAAAALPLALVPFAAALPAAAKKATIDYPRSGVVCDQATKMCFDRTGVSVRLTREFFGRSAERELERKLSGSNRPTQFKLSNGDVCDVRRQTCWDDGWGGKNISKALSKQLFGNNGAWRNPGSNNNSWNNSNNNGWNNNNNNWQQQGQGSTACELRQGNRRLFNGNCVLRDASGVWPVQVSNRNGNVSFRWSDLRLEAQDSRWNNQGQQGGFEDVNPTGLFLQNLFNTLFR